jgi:lysophospholipase L1-like esterase
MKTKLLLIAFTTLLLPVSSTLLTPLSAVRAQGFDNLPDPIEDVNKVVDNTPDSIGKALMSRPKPGSTRRDMNPVLFLVGNSTMRNGTLGNGNNGQWGWGYYFQQYFQASKITVENQALGGMSTRTFYTDLWPAVRQVLEPGDWVVVSIGHNDNGDFFDQKRARAVIPGVDEDTCYVGFNQRLQRQDTVYSYGHYLRCYIRECRARGANPILMSLTPRDAFDDKGNIVRKPQTEWAAYIAAVEGVPFVDLNEISGAKLDTYSRWKQQYHFFGDKIHTSKFGAEMNARSAAEGIFYSHNPQLETLRAMMKNVPLKQKSVQREDGKPVVFFTGDSTVKNADKDNDGMWGWASQAQTVFDERKITLFNAGRAGRSTRTFIKEGLWEEVYNSLQPGDYVTIQFGHNDICPITDAKARGVIPGTADTCHVYKLDNGQYEVVYSFGWYLRKMIDDCREKGATPILVSLTPRNEWPDGRVERRDSSYGRWYREVVEQTGVAFVDVHNISADFLDQKFSVKQLPHDKQQAKAKIAAIKKKAGARYFKQDHTHTSKLGAQMNAQSFAKGLRDIGSPLAQYLK